MQFESRRNFIRTIGGTVIVAATANLGGCGSMPKAALEGWLGPQKIETDPRRRALSFALLSPNPHNLQSWLVDLRQDNAVILYIDKSRLLPMTDPYSRQITIGCGCFLEVLSLAANSEGYSCNVELFPNNMQEIENGQKPVAKITFAKSRANDEYGLAAQILQRRSNKGVYDKSQTLNNPQIIELCGVNENSNTLECLIKNDTKTVNEIANFVAKAFAIEVDTDRTYLESVRKMRIGSNEILAHRDGLSMTGAKFLLFDKLGFMSEDAQMKKNGTARNIARELYKSEIASTNSYGFIITNGNDRLAQISAGKAYVRLNLKATAMGLAMAPMSQILQEYDEMRDLQLEFMQSFDISSNKTVQMLFRLGKAQKVPPTPRRRLDDLILG